MAKPSSCSGEAHPATRSPTTLTRTSRTWIRAWTKCSRSSLQDLRTSRCADSPTVSLRHSALITQQTIACGQPAARENGARNAAVGNKDCVVLEICDEHEIYETGFGGAALRFAGAVHCGGGGFPS